ncbi:MAG TPA: hypothetical protein VK874_01230 [Gaiellaceae bacterium]|nr:hypothetical protein [Gaiellaceae bacterium]
MSEQQATGETADRLSPRTRTILVWSLVALGTLILLVGSLTVWVKRQAVDTDKWVATSSRLLEDDEVRQALAVYVVDELYRNVDVQARLEQRLPENLEGLSAPLAGALRSPAEQAVDRILQRPRVQDLWERVNRASHEALLRVLEDETRAESVSTAGGVVTLDLRVLLVNIGEELGFAERLDARLPEDAGQITVLESDELDTAQTALKTLKTLSWLTILAAIAAFGGALALARNRRELLRVIAAAFVVVGILLLVIRRAVGNYVVDALAAGESVRDAIGSSWLIGTSLLAQVAWALILFGLVMLAGALLAGPAGAARRVRGAVAPGFRDRPVTGWLVLGGVFLLLVLWAPVPALETWPGVLLLGALVAVGFEAFRRLTVAELEAEPPAEVTAGEGVAPAPPAHTAG